jgi:hypothetical protein
MPLLALCVVWALSRLMPDSRVMLRRAFRVHFASFLAPILFMPKSGKRNFCAKNFSLLFLFALFLNFEASGSI